MRKETHATRPQHCRSLCRSPYYDSEPPRLQQGARVGLIPLATVQVGLITTRHSAAGGGQTELSASVPNTGILTGGSTHEQKAGVTSEQGGWQGPCPAWTLIWGASQALAPCVRMPRHGAGSQSCPLCGYLLWGLSAQWHLIHKEDRQSPLLPEQNQGPVQSRNMAEGLFYPLTGDTFRNPTDISRGSQPPCSSIYGLT